MKKLAVPKFATEAEEARWWDEHMDAVGENLIAAMKSGTAHRGGPRRVLQERRESRRLKRNGGQASKRGQPAREDAGGAGGNRTHE